MEHVSSVIIISIVDTIREILNILSTLMHFSTSLNFRFDFSRRTDFYHDRDISFSKFDNTTPVARREANKMIRSH